MITWFRRAVWSSTPCASATRFTVGQDAVDARPGLGRRRQASGSPRATASGARCSRGKAFGFVGAEVPLVDDEDEALALVPRERGELLLLAREALDGVDHQHDDVGAADRLDGAPDRRALERVLHLAAAADAGGVDEHVARAADVEQRIERVAGRAGGRVDDGALEAEQSGSERRLAGVRTADDGDADGVVGRRRRPRR
jgi:hypothetical protein